MKDQMARNKIDAVIKEVDEMKEEIKLLRKWQWIYLILSMYL